MTVVNMSGNELIDDREPSEELIKALESYLEKAKSGEINAMMIAVQYHNGHGEYRISGRVGGFSQFGAAQMGVIKLNQMIDEMD